MRIVQHKFKFKAFYECAYVSGYTSAEAHFQMG